MNLFTKQEKCVILFIAAVVFLGGGCRILFQKYPHLGRHLRVIDHKKSYFSVDVNTARQEDLIKIPYIGEYTARNIINYRRENGPFKDLTDLKKVKGIRDKNYQEFVFYLRIL